MQLGWDVRLAKQLQEICAALRRHRHVGKTVEQDRRRKALDVGRGRCEPPRFLAAPLRHRKLTAETFPRSTRDGVVRETGRDIGRHAGVAAFAFELRTIRRRGREYAQMYSSR